MRQTQRVTNDRLIQYYDNPQPHMRALRFLPNISLVAGQVLGEVTGASQNDVQTIDATGTVSGGTFTLSVTGIDGGTYTTDALAYNISNANLKIAVEDLFEEAGYDGVTVTVTTGPLPADTVLTFGGTMANFPAPLLSLEDAEITGGGSLAIVHTTTGRMKGLFGAYDDGASDGRQVAKALSEYALRTDYTGRIVLGGETGRPYMGVYTLTAPAFFSGRFLVGDLTGLDANAVADLGRLESGTSVSDDNAVLVII
jgi:hypothetical protein